MAYWTRRGRDHLPSTPAHIKKYWQDRAAQGGPFTKEEAPGFLHYCQGDVDLTARVLIALWEKAGLSDPRIFKQATTFRGRFMAAAARIYETAIPLHMPSVKRLIRYAGSGAARAHQEQEQHVPGLSR